MEYQESGYIDKLRRIYFGPSSSSSSCAGSSSAAASSEAEVKLTAANAAGMLLNLLHLHRYHFSPAILNHKILEF